MKNPYQIKLKDNSIYSIGDPFILRYNGRYYLYPSGLYEEEGIRCFISNDLIHFEDKGFVVEDKILKCAYAPEVIYHDGNFYLCTSPLGNGHYLYKSDNPLGPFKRISENVNNMIDGSFFLDENFNLKFLRADHNGIALLDIENENHLINRKNILPAVSNGWTEGPSLFYRNGYYYITYCGNFLTSTSYRVKVASSKQNNQNYLVQNEPLLISTDKDFHSLGHNSVFLGPSLDDYYLAYHSLVNLENDGHFRYLNIDRLSFSNRHVSCNPCEIEQSNFIRPDFECFVDENNLLIKDDFYLSKDSTKQKFTIEYNLKGNNTLVFSYQNSNKYCSIELEDNLIKVYENNILLVSKKLSINFNNFHTLRLINDSKLEILIDNVPIISLKSVNKGRIGYKSLNGVSYTAFINEANGSLQTKETTYVPNIIECKSTKGNFKNDYLDEAYIVLKQNKKVNYKIQTKNRKIRLVYLLLKSTSKGKILLTCNKSKKIININPQTDEYEFINYYLDELMINTGILSIKLLEGNVSFKRIIIKDKIKNNFTQEEYHFTKPCLIQSFDFEFNSFTRNSLFGLILNASNYSSHSSNNEPKYMGYLIGFINNLLVIEHVQYGKTRIYDKPIDIKLHQKYNLKIYYCNSILKVYLNEEQIIQTTLNYDDVYGYGGFFINREADVQLTNYKEETK